SAKRRATRSVPTRTSSAPRRWRPTPGCCAARRRRPSTRRRRRQPKGRRRVRAGRARARLRGASRPAAQNRAMLDRGTLRFVLQAAFLAGAAAVAGLLRLGVQPIVLVMAGAMALVVVSELLAARRPPQKPPPAVAKPPAE